MSQLNSKGSVPLHTGAITALACWVAAVLAFALHLDNPWWASVAGSWPLSSSS